jgi:hypothetical protein
LDVGVHFFVRFAAATEVDDFNGRAAGGTEEDVLGFEVTVDDVDVGLAEEEEGAEDLLGKFSGEVEGNASELCVLEEFV